MPNRARKMGTGGMGKSSTPSRAVGDRIIFDPYRAIVFPNNLRVLRKQRGYGKLLGLSSKLPDIPYIRLSKIERGEVVAKPEELVRIASALQVDPLALLIDVEDAGFDMTDWASDLVDIEGIDRDEEEFAVLLGAALRLRRTHDDALSIAVLDKEFGLPPVILSRVENAQKTLDRWNEQTVRSLCRVFGVPDMAALRDAVLASYQHGDLAPYLSSVSNPEHRVAKTAAKVAELRAALGGSPVLAAQAEVSSAAKPQSAASTVAPSVKTDTTTGETAGASASPDVPAARLVPVYGAALPDGLVARAPTGDTVESPRNAGPRAWGLRVCRATLGIGLPARSVVIVDPDRFPSPGGLAVIDEGEGVRVLMVTVDRQGALIGYSENPAREIPVDTLDPSKVAAVVSAVFE
ncbi:helix-turn-helix transcriptional regulator [Iodidimonas sp. SYSU 1G8]|uniref:helix-turn-helix domain-containing protein n=1 Tax=Iodidimonas sp. SYSU 1G8 TaxID=3133967 RepID=UPI0031FE7ACF